MKKLFASLLCIMLILFLPAVTLAASDLGDYIGPEVGVIASMIIAAAVIALDTVLGILLGIKDKTFDAALLPRFLFTGILPFVGGLIILAVLANYIATPFAEMFYVSAAAIAAKYIADVWEKLKLLFSASPVTPEEISG